LGLHALFVDQSPSPTLLPGTTTKHTVHFRNVGNTPWLRGGRTQVNLGINGDLSSFAALGIGCGWLSPNRVATTSEEIVLPGMIGTYTFPLRAPADPGAYRLPIRPVADGITWLEDGAPAVVLTSDLGFHSSVVEVSSNSILHPGDVSTLTVKIRNTGARTWTKGQLGQQVNLGAVGDDKFIGTLGVGWPTHDRVAVQSEPTVLPGGLATFTFRVRGPSVPGVYPLRLRPVVDGVTWLEDDDVVSL